jgi:4-oxalocrotonate tautomerase
MPFANIKAPQAALSKAQKEEMVHRITAMFVEYFGEAARPHCVVLIEDVPDGGYGRADEVFVVSRRVQGERLNWRCPARRPMQRLFRRRSPTSTTDGVIQFSPSSPWRGDAPKVGRV